MRRYRRWDKAGIDIGIVNQVERAGARLQPWIHLLQGRQPLFAQITHARNDRFRREHEVSHQVRSPVTITDDADSNHSTSLAKRVDERRRPRALERLRL